MAKKLDKINVVGACGVFLVAEGCLSILGSQDQQIYSQIGRVIRIAIGAGLVIYKW